MILRNKIISNYKNKNLNQNIINLERGNINYFFAQKKAIKEHNPDIIITDYLPDEKLIQYDNSFKNLIVDKGVILKSDSTIKSKLLSFININKKTSSLIKQLNGVEINYGKNPFNKDIISHEFLLFDAKTISKIKIFHTRISFKTKIIIVSKFLPDYLENIISPNQLIHIKEEALDLRSLVKILTSNNSINNYPTDYHEVKHSLDKTSNNDTFTEIKISEIPKINQTWDEKHRLEFSKYKLLNLLENQDTHSVAKICNLILSKKSHFAFKSLLSEASIKRKKYLNHLWENFLFCKYYLKYDKINSIDENKLKESINLFSTEIVDSINTNRDLILNKRYYKLLNTCNNIPKELFNINLKDLNDINSLPLLSLFFYYRNNELDKLPSDEFSKLPPIVQHFTYFKFSSLKQVSHLKFHKFKNDTLDSNLDPISLCLRFTRFHKLRNLNDTEEELIFLKIFEFFLSSKFESFSNCYFTNSLFLYFSCQCKNKFFKDQINLLVSDTNLCLVKLKFYLDILEKFEPSFNTE